MSSILFVWRGYDVHGRTRCGRAWAVSGTALEQRLSSFLYGVSVRVSCSMIFSFGWWYQQWARLTGRRLLSVSHAGQVCVTLATLLKAGVPLVKAFRLIARGSSQSATKHVFILMAEHAARGGSLAACFSATASWWPAVVPVALAAGMQRGELATLLEQLGASFEAYEQYRQQLWRALLVPLVTIGVGGVVVYGIAHLLLPLIADVSRDAGCCALLERVGLVERVGPFVLLLAGAGGVICWRALGAYHELQCWRDRLLYKIPLFGAALSAVHAIATVTIWSVLVCAGLPLYDAIRVSADVPNNAWWRHRMICVAEQMRRGRSLAQALAVSPLPAIMCALFSLAEGSREFVGMSAYAVMVEERALRYRLDRRLALLQPALLISIGGGVVWLMSRFLIPLLSLSA